MNAATETAQALATLLGATVVADSFFDDARVKTAEGKYIAHVRNCGEVSVIVGRDGRAESHEICGSVESMAAYISARQATAN
jgi:hypothetical protein